MATIREIKTLHATFRDASEEELPGFIDQPLKTCRLVAKELEQRLSDIGYPVNPVVRPPTDSVHERMAKLEATSGLPIPYVLKRFWETIGEISFVDLKEYSHVDFWDHLSITGPSGYCDGVCVEGCSEELCEYMIEDFDDRYGEDSPEEFYYIFAPDGYHKDDISGGPPYGITGDPRLPRMTYFRWSGHRVPKSAPTEDVDFLGYLRTSLLECGGFPGLLGDPNFEPIREELIEGLPFF